MIDVYNPTDNVVYPGERAAIDLGIGLRFPPNVCGLLMLKPNVDRQHTLRMQPRIVGEFNSVLAHCVYALF